MGKLKESLQKQLNTKYQKEAEDCIKIYDKLLSISRENYNEECVRHYRNYLRSLLKPSIDF